VIWPVVALKSQRETNKHFQDTDVSIEQTEEYSTMGIFVYLSQEAKHAAVKTYFKTYFLS
jgi:hypothetical protein